VSSRQHFLARKPHSVEREVRRRRIAPVVLVTAVFGPYISQSIGLRTEQVAVYAVAAVAALALLYRPTVHPVIALPFLAWIGFLVTLVLGSVARPTGVDAVPGLPILGGIDDALLPVASMLIANWWLTRQDANPEDLARTLVSATVVLMAVNSLLSLISLTVDLTPALSRFWSSEASATGVSVAARALAQGRYTGLFNQPAEAGIAYSVALTGCVYLFAARSARPIRLALLGGLLIVGGLLTVSKVFVLIGVPIAGLQLATQGARRIRTLVSLAALSLVAWGMTTPQWSLWQGQAMLSRLLGSSNSGVVDLYTAGRLGAEGEVTGRFLSVLRTSPWFGFGVRGLQIPYDSAWLAAIVLGGMLGVVAMVGVYASFPILWIRSRRYMPPPARRFAAGLICVTIGASIGVPSLTANRASTLLWLLLPVVLAIGREHGLSSGRPGPWRRTEHPARDIEAGLSDAITSRLHSDSTVSAGQQNSQPGYPQ
jgi:hypothetical protein